MPATVLVIHDEPSACKLIIGPLQAAGQDVVGFGDPMTALDAVLIDSRVRVLVTRVNFGPGKLNGVNLSLMLKVKRPKVKTVFAAAAPKCCAEAVLVTAEAVPVAASNPPDRLPTTERREA
jgi:DNA-binding NtrC family response regulator